MSESNLTSQKASANAHRSWGLTKDRAARTANGRKAFQDRFLEEADGDPKRAESLRRAFYKNLTIKSVEARRRRRELDVSNDKPSLSEQRQTLEALSELIAEAVRQLDGDAA